MLFNFSYAALALAVMSVAVEGRGIGGGRGRGGFGGRAKQGAKKAGEHAGDAAGAAGTAAGFVPAGGNHAVHNCCVNDGGWTYNDRAKSLTKTVCDGYSSASMYNGACAEAAGSGSISGDAFYDACRALAPNDESVGAGYRGSC
ncbi:hypothetical protein DDE82_003219 [Stemphylium lycopersici]|uniref:Uncharacterized protein n=1 Tax=Stemphylium lycopersici TaxID=183478 RepID=A0A364N3M7_STELY|nr:hypothetical protein TW65_06127 [Stemphylium lycopersici]RAR06683.1 hypothetical protein DDE82_003219 [Stemphylium lycopersici]RAR11063.1 hypothetical protein DDE83_004821 [Stemphylium lycopersici]